MSADRNQVEAIREYLGEERKAAAETTATVIPKIRGQERDYLVMALRAYRNDRRESATMHKMSLPYGDAVIESIASYYASQPAK